MEATIQSTNKAISIDVNVSINAGALKANIQRVLSAVAKLSIFRSTSGRSQGENFRFSIWRVYRQELRLARAVARTIDAHPMLSNIWIGGWAVAGIYLIFMYA